jgi:hypothetical protein
MTGLLGTGPERCRSARPRVDTRGRGVCSPATKRNAQPVLQTPLRALRAPASSARTDPHEPLAAKALATSGGPSGISAPDSTAAAGGIRDEMTRGEDEPEPDGS